MSQLFSHSNTVLTNPRRRPFSLSTTSPCNRSKFPYQNPSLRCNRYNDFQHDEFSKCNCTPPYSAENAISARCDLNPANGTYPFGALGHRSHGATDAKITNFGLFKDLEFLAVSGPTHDPLPPFRWSTSGLKDLHEGHPDLWVFAPHVHHWTKDGRLPA